MTDTATRPPSDVDPQPDAASHPHRLHLPHPHLPHPHLPAAGLAPLLAARVAVPPSRPSRVSRTAVLAWVLGTAAYLAAVFNRSTLSVAGIAATERFAVSGALLSLLAVVQLGVYAALQIPVGTVLDRLGSRRLLVVGGLTMAAGEAVFALAPTFGLAVAGRVLVGVGDAMTFISVTRLTSLWFPGRRVALAVQVTGVFGSLGAILATTPLIALIGVGWTPAFLVVAAVTAAIALLIAVALPEAPPRPVVLRTVRPRRVARRLSRRVAGVWQEPGTRLGMWCHFVTAFPASAFGVLWGYPYLVQGQGMSPAAAGSVLIALNLTTAGASPALGQLIATRPDRRVALVLAAVGAAVAAWTLMLTWPGAAPDAVVVAAVVAIAVGGPASMAGLDLARTSNRRELMGTATGLANVGGFTASLLTMLGIGIVLSLARSGAGSLPAADDPVAFEVAFTVPYLVWAVGLTQVLRLRRRVRRRDPGARSVPVTDVAVVAARP